MMCRRTPTWSADSAPCTGFPLMSIAPTPETYPLLSGNVPSLAYCHFVETDTGPQSMRLVTQLALFDSSLPWA